MSRAQAIVLALTVLHALLGVLCLAMARGEYKSPALRWWGGGLLMYACGLLINVSAGMPSAVPHHVFAWLGNSLVTAAPLLCTTGLFVYTSVRLNYLWAGLGLSVILGALVLANFAGMYTSLTNLIGSTLYAISLFLFAAWALARHGPDGAHGPARVLAAALAFGIVAWTGRTIALVFFTGGGADTQRIDQIVSFSGIAQLAAGTAATFALMWIQVRLAQVQLARINESLAEQVRTQVDDIERLGQLKHFFAAPVAEMILNQKGFDPSHVHRREVTVMAVDLRAFTAFSETAEPEEVIGVLRAYHAELGVLVNRNRATLEHFAGDGAILFLNDPVEVPDHPLRACEMAVQLETALRPRLREWQRQYPSLGLGIGLATGYATIGAIGFEGRWEYSAIGSACNLAARLCAEARDGQILIPHRLRNHVGERISAQPLGEMILKGFAQPVAVFNLLSVPGSPVAEPDAQATKRTIAV